MAHAVAVMVRVTARARVAMARAMVCGRGIASSATTARRATAARALAAVAIAASAHRATARVTERAARAMVATAPGERRAWLRLPVTVPGMMINPRYTDPLTVYGRVNVPPVVVVPASGTSIDPKPMETPVAPKPKEGMGAKLNFRVPAEAKLFVDGRLTAITGTERTSRRRPSRKDRSTTTT